MVEVSIIGATGYTGIELIRILRQHPKVEINHVISHSNAGKNLSDIYPHFTGEEDKLLEEYKVEKMKDSDLVFTALPHGVSQKIVGQIYDYDNNIKIIDLSGDFRYKDNKLYEKWYNCKHERPDLLKKTVYGLVELNRKNIKKSSFIGNPGCYPTASLLGVAPFASSNMIELDSIIIDAKSGVSGAGRSLSRTTHFSEVDENLKAYGITTHRHTSEIEENLEKITGKEKINISFTPHLIPMKRGILATIYIDLKDKLNINQLFDLYYNFYSNSPFVQILKENNPETKNVSGTNNCQIGLNIDQRLSRAIIVSVIDNLGKGAAGQAVQNMNIMFDFPETMGLKTTAVFP